MFASRISSSSCSVVIGSPLLNGLHPDRNLRRCRGPAEAAERQIARRGTALREVRNPPTGYDNSMTGTGKDVRRPPRRPLAATRRNDEMDGISPAISPFAAAGPRLCSTHHGYPIDTAHRHVSSSPGVRPAVSGRAEGRLPPARLSADPRRWRALPGCFLKFFRRPSDNPPRRRSQRLLLRGDRSR